jgi:hypothetical protein
MWSSNYPTIFGKYFDAKVCCLLRIRHAVVVFLTRLLKKIGFSGLCVGGGEIIGGLLFGRMADRLGKTRSGFRF